MSKLGKLKLRAKVLTRERNALEREIQRLTAQVVSKERRIDLLHQEIDFLTTMEKADKAAARQKAREKEAKS